MSTPVTFAYSRGTSKYDNYPAQRTATTFAEFAEAVLADRAQPKGLTYICSAFKPNGDGRHHRCLDDALPRRFLPFDMDGAADGEVFSNLVLWLQPYSGFGYTTASHTPNKPRLRFVLELDREVDRAEGERIGLAIQRRIDAELGAGRLKWDPSVYRAEQPLFTPPFRGAQTFRFEGEPVDVDALLAEAPDIEPERPGAEARAQTAATADPVLRRLSERDMVLREVAPGKYAVVCPFDAEHQEKTSESSTVYYLPNFGGVRYGKFHCLHSPECTGGNGRPPRSQEELLRALDLDPRRVWAEQAGREPKPPSERETLCDWNPGEPPDPQGAASQANGEATAPIPDAPPISTEEFAVARLTPRCIVSKYLFADVAVLAGPGGAGKTTLILYEIVHVILGLPLFGLEVENPGPVLLVTAEDQRERLVARLRMVCEALHLTEEQVQRVREGVLIWDVTGTACRLAELDEHGNVILTGLADAITEIYREHPPVLVAFDPAISFGAGERLVNDNEQALITAARRIVRELGCCVRLIHHTGKANARERTLDQYTARGGSALPDGARMVAVLQPWQPGCEGLPPRLGSPLDKTRAPPYWREPRRATRRRSPCCGSSAAGMPSSTRWSCRATRTRCARHRRSKS